MSFYSFYGGRRGLDFVISKTYQSIDEMEQDFGRHDCEVEIGQYVMIDVRSDGETLVDEVDTGKLFQRTEEGPLYITDLSGPQGSTPKLYIGTVDCPQGTKTSRVEVNVTDIINPSGNYTGASLDFSIPIPAILLTVETIAQEQNVTIERVNDAIDSLFTPHYHMRVPRGSRGISIDNLQLTTALDGSEESHLIVNYIDPSYPHAVDSVAPYAEDLGLLKYIDKLEVDINSNLNCYYSNDPTVPVRLVTIRYITDLAKEPDIDFTGDPSTWQSVIGTDAAKIYAKFSDTGFNKNYLGTLSSISNIGKVTIPKTGTMLQNAEELRIGLTDGRVINLGDIRGNKGDPGAPLHVYTYYQTITDLIALADKTKIVGLKPVGADDMSLWFYDQERLQWVDMGTLTADKGGKILVQADEPASSEQSEGDVWFIAEEERE